VLLRWPAEEGERRALDRSGTPRLLVVEPDATPPDDVGLLEDWVRPSADALEIRTRLATLETRARAHGDDHPVVDEGDVLRSRERWVALGPIEARLVRLLLARPGQVVGRDEVAAAGWPDTAPSRTAIDIQILRVRRHLGTFGLRVLTLRGQGWVLERVPDARVATTDTDQEKPQ
jgi:DNA-binding winged helix-turn-helix (wHTH) protein